MLFVMVEHGVDNRVAGNKGKAFVHQANDDEDEAMWAIILAKELWKKNVWYATLALINCIIDHETRMDTKTVTIIALGCAHSNTKVQSASIHFFIGQDADDAPDESENQHVRNMN